MLQWLAWLLFSFRGRIPRTWYWLAQLILFVPAVVEYLIIYGPALPKEPELPAPFLIVWNLVLWFPAFAVTVKRLNDRGHPAWVAAIWLASIFASWLSAYVLLTDPAIRGGLQKALLVITPIVNLWFFIDLWILRGERGPNRYGPDPLATADAYAAPQPVQRCRSIGENIRDGATGAMIVIAALVFSGWNFGIPELSHRAFHWLVTPKWMRTWEERVANRPASEALGEGNAAFSAGNFDDALRHYSRAIELYGPETTAAASSYRTRAYALETMGRLQEALSDLDKAIALEPDWSPYYLARVYLLSRMGRYDDALKDIATLLRRDPNSGDRLIDRGEVLEKMGRREEALADYTQAIIAARNNYDKQMEKEREQARKEEHARNRDRTIAGAHVARGNAFRAMDRAEEALAEYAQALEVLPDDRNIYVNRGWLYEKQGRLDLARTDYEKAASLRTPNDWLKRALERTR
jgi:tetratricopeptide (TPR) repeat protein/uncharacterized membrane protein YhaH (DUF805 family)